MYKDISDDEDMDFIKITDDDVAYALSQEAKAMAIIMMQKDLKSYIANMGSDASFKGWIAHICPENVAVDVRLEMPGSAWHALWNIEKKHSTFSLKSPEISVRDTQIRNQCPPSKSRTHKIPKANINRSRRNRHNNI
jgi:hypothetical protein